MDKKFLLKDSKHFCMSAWSHLHALPDGKVIACCLSPMDEPVGDLHTEDLVDVWNGERMKELRRNMLDDKPTPSICSRCYSKEEHGLASLRTGMNSMYGRNHFDLVETTKPDGHVDKLNLIHWDFRFSNICNLKCRTCGPGFSSAWNDDFKALHSPEMDKATFQSHVPKFQRLIKNEARFWEVMTPLFDTVEMIHFAGGEPLIMDEHYRILNELIERRQYKVQIRYSTNCSQMIYKGQDVIEMWEPFKNIDLSLSIDAMDDRFSYVRSGGSWSETKANLERLRARRDEGRLEGVRWFFHPTISALNVLHFLDLHRFLLEEGHIVKDRFFFTPDHYVADVVLNPVIYPDHYNIQMLPASVKAKVRDKYLRHAEWAEAKYGFPAEGLMSVVEFMEREDKTEHLSTFVDITKRLDKIRGENFVDLFPEMSELLSERWNFGGAE